MFIRPWTDTQTHTERHNVQFSQLLSMVGGFYFCLLFVGFHCVDTTHTKTETERMPQSQIAHRNDNIPNSIEQNCWWFRSKWISLLLEWWATIRYAIKYELPLIYRFNSILFYVWCVCVCILYSTENREKHTGVWQIEIGKLWFNMHRIFACWIAILAHVMMWSTTHTHDERGKYRHKIRIFY